MVAKKICARIWETKITKSERTYFMDDPLQSRVVKGKKTKMTKEIRK